jgi:hypothetical protein
METTCRSVCSTDMLYMEAQPVKRLYSLQVSMGFCVCSLTAGELQHN